MLALQAARLYRLSGQHRNVPEMADAAWMDCFWMKHFRTFLQQFLKQHPNLIQIGPLLSR